MISHWPEASKWAALASHWAPRIFLPLHSQHMWFQVRATMLRFVLTYSVDTTQALCLKEQHFTARAVSSPSWVLRAYYEPGCVKNILQALDPPLAISIFTGGETEVLRSHSSFWDCRAQLDSRKQAVWVPRSPISLCLPLPQITLSRNIGLCMRSSRVGSGTPAPNLEAVLKQAVTQCLFGHQGGDKSTPRFPVCPHPQGCCPL